MKKIAVGLAVAILAVLNVQPVQAQETKTIAIIDTAIDSSRFNNIVYEACFTQNGTCPNKSNFQEGRGSANVSNWNLSGIDHGHNIVQAAVLANPNIKIVFIRYNDQLASRGHGDMNSMARALEWLSNNAAKFNIGIVSISQASGLYTANTCSAHTAFSLTRSSVTSLLSQNVLVFAATGNGQRDRATGQMLGSTTHVGFPACVENVVGVGALSVDETSVARYTDAGDKLLDIVSVGEIRSKSYNNWNTATCSSVTGFIPRTARPSLTSAQSRCLGQSIGTSIASPIAATLLITNAKTNVRDLISSLPKIQGYPFITK